MVGTNGCLGLPSYTRYHFLHASLKMNMLQSLKDSNVRLQLFSKGIVSGVIAPSGPLLGGATVCWLHWFPKGLWVFQKQSLTVNSDWPLSDFLTCSDGSLTLPVDFRETHDGKQTGLTHFHPFSFQYIFGLQWMKSRLKANARQLQHDILHDNLKNKYHMKT